MCQKSTLYMISQSSSGYMGYCAGCDKYNLVFENIFIHLSEKEVIGMSTIVDMDFGAYVLKSAIGRGKTISLATPTPNTYFTFTSDEYEEFKRLINETVLMIDANSIIKLNNKKTD